MKSLPIRCKSQKFSLRINHNEQDSSQLFQISLMNSSLPIVSPKDYISVATSFTHSFSQCLLYSHIIFPLALNHSTHNRASPLPTLSQIVCAHAPIIFPSTTYSLASANIMLLLVCSFLILPFWAVGVIHPNILIYFSIFICVPRFSSLLNMNQNILSIL